MTNVDTRTRVAAGVRTGGQFAEEAKSEPDLNLAPGTGSWPEPSLEDVINVACDRYGEGYRAGFEAQATIPRTDEGKELYRRTLAGAYHPDYQDDRLTYQKPRAADCDVLAELGYRDPADLMEKAVAAFGDAQAVVQQRIAKDRLDAVHAIGRNRYQWTNWEREAYLSADLDALKAVAEAPDWDSKYEAIAAARGPQFTARLQEAKNVGLKDWGLIEYDHHPAALLKNLQDAMPPSKRDPMSVAKMANMGHTAVSLKSFGATVCERFTDAEVFSSTLTPAQLRSLHSGMKRAGIGDLEKLHNGGLTNGKEVRELSKAMRTEDVDVLVGARRHITGEQMAQFAGFNKGTSFTVDEAAAAAELLTHGYEKAADLRHHATAVYGPSRWCIDRKAAELPIFANIVKAGITPERLGVMTRAGIPADRAHEFVNTEDLWEAGRQFRDAYAKDQDRRVKDGWSISGIPWEFSKEDFEKGWAS